MEDLDNLIAEGEKRNIGLMFDILWIFGYKAMDSCIG